METKTEPQEATGNEIDPTPDASQAIADPPPTEVVDKPEPWTKKRKARKKKWRRTKRRGIAGRKWSWGYINVFQPVRRWSIKGRLVRPTLRSTIAGCVYYAIKRIKRGNDARVHQAAIEDGLEMLTVQQTFPRVQDELRKLARLGVITRSRHPRRRRS